MQGKRKIVPHLTGPPDTTQLLHTITSIRPLTHEQAHSIRFLSTSACFSDPLSVPIENSEGAAIPKLQFAIPDRLPPYSSLDVDSF